MLRLLALLLVAALAGCAAQPPSSEPPSWERTVATLSGLQHWQLRGKVGLRDAQRAESASMRWLQQDENSLIQLSGPMGLHGVTVRVDNQTLEVLRDDSLQRWDLSDPAALTAASGLPLPLDALRYWIKGVPAPGKVDSLQIENGLLQRLQQYGWQLQYLGHVQVGRYQLPERLQIHRAESRVTLIIRQWNPMTE